jgi:hypothetical protein
LLNFNEAQTGLLGSTAANWTDVPFHANSSNTDECVTVPFAWRGGAGTSWMFLADKYDQFQICPAGYIALGNTSDPPSLRYVILPGIL